jgi:hypothetical protein
VNIEQFRKSLRVKWLDYYRDNRSWLTRIAVWVTCEGVRRPSSSFILATLSVLEPRLTELMPLVVDLSNHPDRVIIALGLNFSPEEELEKLEAESDSSEAMKMLPASAHPVSEVDQLSVSQERSLFQPRKSTNPDEACRGVRSEEI